MKNPKAVFPRLKEMAIVVAALGTSFAALANDGPYIGSQGGANVVSDQKGERGDQTLFQNEFKTGYIGGIVAGYSLSNGWRPELAFDFRRNQAERTNFGGTSFNADGHEDAITAFGNLWYDIKTPTGFFSRVHPYIGGGIGDARIAVRDFKAAGVSQPNSWENLFAYQGGAGIGVDLNRHLSLSLDYRHMKTVDGTFETSLGNVKANYRAQSLMAGARYTFDRPAPIMARAPDPVPEPMMAAPAPAPVAPPPAPPADSDGDGVPDFLDKCPNTPRGFAVDANGCIIKQSVILRGVNFVFNKAELTGPAKETLDSVAAALVGQPDLAVQIAGHTDSVGSDAYNNRLSQARADSVRNYLVSKGAAAGNLSAKGFGESTPIADNKTEEGRTENRRVEFVVVNKPANVTVQTTESTEGSKAAANTGEPAKLKRKKK